nr:hypothetical protein CFP56_55079 [Quercus suber]
MVLALINNESRGWNSDLIRTSFLPHEADVILGIPLSPMAPEDSQVWTKMHNGIFTVNNAYKVAYKMLKDANPENHSAGCLDNSRIQALWKAI